MEDCDSPVLFGMPSLAIAYSTKGYVKEKFVSKEKGSIFSFESSGRVVSKSRFWTGIDGMDRGIIEDSESNR